MIRRRTARDLAHLSECAWDALALPERQRRALLLEHAWRRVVGESVARRATAAGVTRGVLRIEIPDPRWAAALRGVLPSMVGRLTRRYPDLGVRRFRILTGGADEGLLPVPDPAPEDSPVASTSGGIPRGEASDATAARPAAERIATIAEAYLARFEGRPRRPQR